MEYIDRNLKKEGIEIPHTLFREDSESLDGATTACGFIIPNTMRMFGWNDSASYDRNEPFDAFLPVLTRGDNLIKD